MSALMTAGVTGALIALVLTPLIAYIAKRFGIVDKPDGHRKIHREATPLCGGVAVYFAAISSVLLSCNLYADIWHHIFITPTASFGLLGAATLIVLVGLFDDAFGIRGRHKLVGQVFVAIVISLSGLTVERLEIMGRTFELGVIGIPFTVIWLVGAINALNLLDGIDGLASSVGIVLSLAIGMLAFISGHHADAVIAFAIAGGLLGFLYYNFPPAKIFLGDAGSMLIGLLLGVLAIRCSFKATATVALALPTAIMAIPMLDVSMAILRRKLTGRSIYWTDRGHLHHVLQQKGYGGKRTLLTVVILCFGTASCALFSEYQKNELLALGGVILIVGLIISSRLFGYAEFSLLFERTKQLVNSFVPQADSGEHSKPRQIRAQLQGGHEWERLWEMLVEYGERFDLVQISLNINLPLIHEEFHADWKQRVIGDERLLWSNVMPLTHENRIVGNLRVVGRLNEGETSSKWIGEIVEGLGPFEKELASLITSFLPEKQADEVDKILLPQNTAG